MENNNIEVEVKILEVSRADLEKKIKVIGWEKIFEWELDARWFKNVNWKKVRVRKEWNKCVTEYKEKIWNSDFKEMLEIGITSDNFDNQIMIFEKLWFKQISKSIKTRVSYLLKINDIFWNIRFDFDKYSDLDWMKIPELLEIEASSWEVIKQIAKVIWFNSWDLKNWDARKLSEYYKNL